MAERLSAERLIEIRRKRAYNGVVEELLRELDAVTAERDAAVKRADEWRAVGELHVRREAVARAAGFEEARDGASRAAIAWRDNDEEFGGLINRLHQLKPKPAGEKA